MEFAGVHHVSLNVGDLEQTARFYTEILGLKVLPRPDFGFPGMWLDAGAQQIHLIQVDQHAAPEGQHFALRVEDGDAAARELTGKGVKGRGPFEIPGAGRQCFLRDPSGNLIELNQPA